jgi:hypothetical protein
MYDRRSASVRQSNLGASNPDLNRSRKRHQREGKPEEPASNYVRASRPQVRRQSPESGLRGPPTSSDRMRAEADKGPVFEPECRLRCAAVAAPCGYPRLDRPHDSPQHAQAPRFCFGGGWHISIHYRRSGAPAMPGSFAYGRNRLSKNPETLTPRLWPAFSRSLASAAAPGSRAPRPST